MIASATSGESRSRIRRFGNGRIGRSGNNDDTVSGDIVELSAFPGQLLRLVSQQIDAVPTTLAKTIGNDGRNIEKDPIVDLLL